MWHGSSTSYIPKIIEKKCLNESLYAIVYMAALLKIVKRWKQQDVHDG